MFFGTRFKRVDGGRRGEEVLRRRWKTRSWERISYTIVGGAKHLKPLSQRNLWVCLVLALFHSKSENTHTSHTSECVCTFGTERRARCDAIILSLRHGLSMEKGVSPGRHSEHFRQGRTKLGKVPSIKMKTEKHDKVKNKSQESTVRISKPC